MSKRKLSKQQIRRIQKNQAQRRENAKQATQVEISDDLGPEQLGLITAHFGTQVIVEKTSNGSRVRCHLRANLNSIVTGDEVVFREGPDLGVVESINERRSEIVRPDSYGNLKPVAANVDQIIITIAPKPEPYANLIDRYIVATENCKIKPLIVLNKQDLLNSSSSEAINIIEQQYQAIEYPFIRVSAHTGEGLEKLKQHLCNATSIFVGQSGVGKSSLIQTLLPNENIKIGQLSEDVAKGKHTTTHSQLYHFEDGGSCIDSPGIREFGLWHLQLEDVVYGFKELRDNLQKCQFRDCSHEKEPGCAITSAVENGIISVNRYESFRRIVATLDDVEVKGNRKQKK